MDRQMDGWTDSQVGIWLMVDCNGDGRCVDGSLGWQAGKSVGR
jgi:hypothetical protein